MVNKTKIAIIKNIMASEEIKVQQGRLYKACCGNRS